jgi:pyruvate-formate lyase-activating enzyme
MLGETANQLSGARAALSTGRRGKKLIPIRPKICYYFNMLKRMRPIQASPKVLNYLKYRAATRLPALSTRHYTPQIAGLLLNKRCNLNCDICYVGTMLNEPDWQKSEASLEKVKPIITHKLFRNCLLVDLMGGEPLLVEDLDQIVAYLTSNGHLTNLSTNGVLLADRVADLKRAGISHINISLYEENRRVLERHLAQINRVFQVDTSLVLLRTELEARLEQLVSTARFVHEAGCGSLRIFVYRPMGRDPQQKDLIPYDDPAWLELRRRVDDVVPNFCLWPTPPRPGPAGKRCVQLWQKIWCDMEGNVFACCGVAAPLSGPNSNLFDGAPDAILNHPTFVSMRRKLLDPLSDPPDPCKSCNLLSDSGW